MEILILKQLECQELSPMGNLLLIVKIQLRKRIAWKGVTRGYVGLKLSAWPSELEHPLYDVDLAIILCEMNAFKEVIACYMQAHDHEGLIACCKRLGDSGKGGDPSLW
jgi:hypothetical protein